MQIKTTDGVASVSSKALGGTALGLAIPGTLAFLQNLGTGILGVGGNGGMNNGNQCNSHVKELLGLSSELSKERAERYSDGIGLEAYKVATTKAAEGDKALNDKFIFLLEKFYETDKRVSAIEVAGPLREQLVQQQITCCCNSTNAAITALQNTVNGLIKTVIPSENICPEPMPMYNSWTAPTTTTTT